MEAAIREYGMDARIRLETSEGLEFWTRNQDDRDWVMCTAYDVGPPEEGAADHRLFLVADGQLWKAVFNVATGRLYRVFGFPKTDLRELLIDAVGSMQGEGQASLIAKFYALHVYAEETEILWSEWDAYAFTFSHIGRDGSELDDRRAEGLAKSRFWRKVHGHHSLDVRRVDPGGGWEVTVTIGSYVHGPGEMGVEFRRLTVAVSDDATVVVKRDELLGRVERNFERRRVDLRLASKHQR